MNKSTLRVATWNCNGAFRKKWEAVDALDPDILVVQECEDPGRTTDNAYKAWASNYLWTGLTKNKGIGVFVRNGLTLSAVTLDYRPLQLFLPVMVNGVWPLLATWTMQANSPTFGYIGQLWKFLQAHKDFLRHPAAMLVGDLNSNAKWDVWDRWWNHSDVVKELADLGLQSHYHRHFEEAQGRESSPTFYMQRKVDKPYHIDYVFGGPEWAIESVEVGQVSDWLHHSDHMPVVVDLKRVDIGI